MKLKILLLNLYFFTNIERCDSTEKMNYTRFVTYGTVEKQKSGLKGIIPLKILMLIGLITIMILGCINFNTQTLSTITDFCGDLNPNKTQNLIEKNLNCNEVYAHRYNTGNHPECSKKGTLVGCGDCDNYLLGDCSKTTSKCTEYDQNKIQEPAINVKCGEIYNETKNNASLDPECTVSAPNPIMVLNGPEKSCSECKNYPSTECKANTLKCNDYDYLKGSIRARNVTCKDLYNNNGEDASLDAACQIGTKDCSSCNVYNEDRECLKSTFKCNDLYQPKMFQPLNSTTNCGELSNFFTSGEEPTLYQCSKVNTSVSCQSCNHYDINTECLSTTNKCMDVDPIKGSININSTLKCSELHSDTTNKNAFSTPECNKNGQTINCSSCTNYDSDSMCSKTKNCMDVDSTKSNVNIISNLKCNELHSDTTNQDATFTPECNKSGETVSCSSCNIYDRDSLCSKTKNCMDVESTKSNINIISELKCGEIYSISSNFAISECNKFGQTISCLLCNNYDSSSECSKTTNCMDVDPNKDSIEINSILKCSEVHSDTTNKDATSTPECNKSGQTINCSSCTNYDTSNECLPITKNCMDVDSTKSNVRIISNLKCEEIYSTNNDRAYAVECSKMGQSISCQDCVNPYGTCVDTTTFCQDYDVNKANNIIEVVSFQCKDLLNFGTPNSDQTAHPECSKKDTSVDCTSCINYDNTSQCLTTLNTCKDYDPNKSDNTVTTSKTCSNLLNFNTPNSDQTAHPECSKKDTSVDCPSCNNYDNTSQCLTTLNTCNDYDTNKAGISIPPNRSNTFKCNKLLNFNTPNSDQTAHPECSKIGSSVDCTSCINYDNTSQCLTTLNTCKDYDQNKSDNTVTTLKTCGNLLNFNTPNSDQTAHPECSKKDTSVDCGSCNYYDNTSQCLTTLNTCNDYDSNKSDNTVTTPKMCKDLLNFGTPNSNQTLHPECSLKNSPVDCSSCVNYDRSGECGNTKECFDYDINKSNIPISNLSTYNFMCYNLNSFFPIFSGGDGSNHTECSKSGIDISCNSCNNYDNSTECLTTTNNCKDYSEVNSENSVTRQILCTNLYDQGEDASNHPECSKQNTSISCFGENSCANYNSSTECRTTTPECKDYDLNKENITINRNLTCGELFTNNSNAENHTECSKSGKEDTTLLESTMVSCSDCKFTPNTECPTTTVNCMDYNIDKGNIPLINPVTCSELIKIKNGSFIDYLECNEIGQEISCDSCTNILEGECGNKHTGSDGGLSAQVILSATSILILVASFIERLRLCTAVLGVLSGAALIGVGIPSFSQLHLTGNYEHTNLSTPISAMDITMGGSLLFLSALQLIRIYSNNL
jgi:hypothetical protein